MTLHNDKHDERLELAEDLERRITLAWSLAPDRDAQRMEDEKTGRWAVKNADKIIKALRLGSEAVATAGGGVVFQYSAPSSIAPNDAIKQMCLYGMPQTEAEALVTRLSATGRNEIIEECARVVERISTALYHEHGGQDPETGAWEIGHRFMETVEAHDEAMNAIRALKGSPDDGTEKP